MQDSSPNKRISIGILVALILTSLLGGLALVLKSLRNINLTLLLDLKKDDTGEKKY